MNTVGFLMTMTLLSFVLDSSNGVTVLLRTNILGVALFFFFHRELYKSLELDDE